MLVWVGGGVFDRVVCFVGELVEVDFYWMFGGGEYFDVCFGIEYLFVLWFDDYGIDFGMFES